MAAEGDDKQVTIVKPRPDVAVGVLTRHLTRLRQRSPEDAALAADTPCFGVQWMNGDGVCDMDGHDDQHSECALRTDCESAYKEIQAKKRAQEKRIAAASAPPKRVWRRRRSERDERDPRGKWKDTSKYARTGYVPVNRQVDKALAVLVDALGDPPTLPKVWSPVNFQAKYAGLGRVVLSQSASYTTVLVDGQIILRCWTNAGGCMIVDVAPELTQAVSKLRAVKLRPVPSGSASKLRPCTHRFDLAFGATLHQDTLIAIGAMIRMAYRSADLSQVGGMGDDS